MRSVAVFLAALALPVCAFGVNLVQNGSFETNGGPNSNVLPGWSIVDEAGGNGTWLAQTGTLPPVTSEFNCGTTNGDVPAPPDGSFAAMATQASPGSHILYQDVAIPAGTNPVLSFQFVILSAGGMASPDSLSHFTENNQQFRADIIDPIADLFTTDVIQNVLLYGTGNPTKAGYERVAVALTGLGGRTVRLRFVEVDNKGCFNAGVDNVVLETQPSGALPPTILRFFPDEDTVAFAGSDTLFWATQNATSVEIDNGVGSVPLSGSKTVALQTGTTFTLTATGPGGTVSRTTSVNVRDPGPSLYFDASPSFIEPGDAATLTWRTTDATDISIDNDIGVVAASGSVTVTPRKTTEYTLTVKGDGVTNTARATVFVDPGDIPIVTVTSNPNTSIEIDGLPSPVGQWSLTNLGKVGTTITLTQTGDFFTQSPAAFDLPPGATQIVTLNFAIKPVGRYSGTITVAGAGVPPDTVLPIGLFVAAAPTGTVAPTTAVARTELAAPAGENPSGSVSFTNNGTGDLVGVASSDAAWLIPESGIITIAPGSTRAVSFTTNRALRPDASSLSGAAVATLSVTYVDSGSGTGALRLPVTHGAASTRTISVTVVDVVKPGATPGGPPPLAPGELAFFVPGLFQRPNVAGDLLVSVIGNSISDLKLYLAAPGLNPLVGSVDQLAPNAGLALPSVLQNVFASSAPTATVQARSASLSRVEMSGVQTSTTPSGSFITALPTFRSDRSAASTEVIYLPGIEQGASVFVQEVVGFAGTARVEYLDAGGNVLGSPDNEAIGAFSLLSLTSGAPASAAAVRVTNTSTNAARLVAYALVTDPKTQDAWTVTGAAAADQVIAIPPGVTSGATTSAVYLFNPGSTPLQITTEGRFSGGRRRTVRPESALTIGGQQTAVLPVNSTNGFLHITASRPFVVAGRSTTTSGDVVFGAALPVFTSSDPLVAGQSRRFGGIEDASATTVAAGTPVTYRSNLGLIESSGQPVVVKLTLRYTFSGGSRTTAQGVSSTNVTISPNKLVMVNQIGRAVIGQSRDGIGDLHNVQLDVEVVSGGGTVAPFLQTIDNGTNDSAIRVQ